MSNTTANTASKSNTATIATNASSSAKKMTSSGSKAVGGGSSGNGGEGGQQQKPSAWSRSSVNPVTGRASGSPVQNGIKSNGATPSASVRLPPSVANEAKGSDRMAYLFANFKGLQVTLLLKNGDRYGGIFSTVESGRYTIKMAKKLPSQGRQANGVTDENAGTGNDRVMSFPINEVVDMHVNDVRFDKAQGRRQNGTSNFQTDTDISQRFAARERDLQKWDGGDNNTDVDLSLGNGHTGEWDQFATHKNMTGLQSTYDENHYTTPLNRSTPGFDERARKAEQLAREIEGTSTMNAHVAEERGLKALDDSGLDEEAKYSGVQREYKPLAASGANAWVPPAKRAPTGQPTVSGAPVDPAIISSSFAKPKPDNASNTKKEEVPVAEAAKSAAPAAASSSASKPADKPAAPALTVKPTTAAVPAPRPAKKEGDATATVEKDVHEAFREFSKSEKLRVQEHQRSLARRDKAVKLNDLKKFAQNFKLTTEVPADLLPILARDEMKQREIKEKAKKNAEDKTTPPRSTATSVAATPADAKAKPGAPAASARHDTPASPLATTNDRPQQRSRQSSQNMGGSRGPPPQMQAGPNNHRQHGNLGQRLVTNLNRGGMPPHPPGPIPAPHMQGVTSPSLQYNPSKPSFIPNAASKTFIPAGPISNASSNSSPVRAPSSQPFEQAQPKQGNLFEGRTEGLKGPIPESERVSLDNAFNPIPTLKQENLASLPEDKRASAPNDGLPAPFKTPVTWSNLVPEALREKTVKDMFPNTLKPAVSPQNPGPHQFQGQIPPYGAQPGFPQQPGFTPNQTPRHMIAQPHHGPGTPQHFEEAQRMQFSQSTSAVHPSPRPMQPFVYNPNGPQAPHFQPQMVYGTSPGGGYPMMARQLSNNPQFQGQGMAGPQMVQTPQGTMYLQNGMPGQVMYSANGQPAFFPQPMGPGQMAQNGYPSPAGRQAQAVMMQPQMSQGGGGSGQHTPQYMPTPYMQPQGPVPQMRYGGPQHHQQFAGQPQHFGHQQPMRGGPGGQYQQPMMMQGVPQGMPMAQPQQEGGEDGK